VFEDCST